MRLFVAQLSFDTTEETLKKTFEAHGAVSSAEIVYNKKTKLSRGFGFVDMDNDEEATKAMEALNDLELDGRNIVVKVAKPKE